MKKLVFIILSLTFCGYVCAQSIAKGQIFEDSNKNGKKDKNEKGVADVAVSNGREVILTDKDGYYELPVGDDNIIFVIKPSGYNIPLDENNLPKSYYIHKPKGSPANLKFKGIPPTGPLPQSIDFALIPADEKDNFKAFIFGDPQPYNMDELDYFARGIIAEASKEQNISFGISLGDLVGDALDLHQPYKKAMKEMGMPWYNVMGNHDMNYDTTIDTDSDESFQVHFGPNNYAFNYGQAHFIILDDIIYPDPRDDKSYWAGFRPDQLEFIANYLKTVRKDELIVLAMHIPLFDETGNEDFRTEDRHKLFELLRYYPNVLVLSAHTHFQMHYFHKQADGWKGNKPLHEYNVGTTSGDWYSGEMNESGIPVSTMRDGTPKGYAFLNISGNKYTIDYKVAGKPRDYQIEIFNPKVVAKDKKTSAQIVANFFMGCENDKVEYRVDNGEWKEMIHTKGVIPSYTNTLFKWDYADKPKIERRPSNAVLSTHLWTAGIPTKLDEGNHVIEVRATDMFGNLFTQTSNYRIE
ncbi:calcineurin-like phosphoesterase family protein [Prevotella sp. 10(H)]|uniref:calcineurin-like phosphoesterase C-terminal domain-containing protein n=1 Tax=Prevotella sp. 10(H) TaxID=1158294 RepID=UPI0004A7839D|nr:calcineurin-like phosphoesterase family protein [Prevotella sp. 10(H)]